MLKSHEAAAIKNQQLCRQHSFHTEVFNALVIVHMIITKWPKRTEENAVRFLRTVECSA